MNRHTRIEIDRIDEMIECLTKLRRALPELERRNRQSAGGDGYPSGSVGGGTGGGTISKPTERAALTRRPADPVRKWTREVLAQLAVAGTAIQIADSRRRLVFDGVEPEPERCGNCGDPADKLIQGRCGTCYQFKRRNGVERPPKVSA